MALHALEAFGKVLEKLKVPLEKCVDLLTAKDANGTSGLTRALQEGKLKAVEKYIEIVKKIAPELDDKQRAALLKEIRKSHAKQIAGRWWVNFKQYEKLKKKNPEFYRSFKEMKNALKAQTR